VAKRADPESVSQEVRELVERRRVYREALDPYYRAIGKEYDFGIKLKQHNDPGRRELARIAAGGEPTLRVVSLDLPDILRYSAATIAGSSIYMDVRPRAPGATDAESLAWQKASEVAQSLMEDQVHDVDLGYPAVRRRFVRMAGAARAGAVRLDLVAGGAYGLDVVPTAVDPRNLSWDSCYLHFNDYGCPELHEDFRIGVEEARNNPDWKWDDPSALQPDDGEQLLPKKAYPTADENAQESDNRRITLTRVWIKHDPGDMEIEVGEPLALPSQRWHMACPTCGYSEADLVDTPGYDGSNLPQMHPCPQCGEGPEGQPKSMMHRVDTERQFGKVPQYTDRHRMVVIAPFCPSAGIGRDGPWPKGLTNFPYGMYVPDPFPLEPYGNSDTFRNQDLVSLKNASLASGFEQMDRNRDLTLVVEDAVWDAQHEPQMFDGSQDYVGYVASPEALNSVKQVQGSGLNPAYVAWMDRLDAELGRHRGIGQISADASQVKGMAVGTVARIQETGDVPLDEQLRILREMEEQLFNRWLELACANFTIDRWQEIQGDDGRRAFALFRAENMPPLRLRVHASPSLNAVDMDKLKSIGEMVGKPPSVIRFFLRDSNIPQDVIHDLMQGPAPVPNGPGGGPIQPQPGMVPAAMG